MARNRRVKRGNVEIVFLGAGFQQILESSAVAEDISRRAERIAAAAGPGMEARTFRAGFGGSPRHAAVVVTATTEARRAEAESKALTSAIDAGR